MTASSPSPETIRFIARILAAQPTSVTDVAETIANIVRTVDNLGAPAAKLDEAPAPKPRAARIPVLREASETEAALVPKTIVLKPRSERVIVTRTRRRIAEETP